MATELIAATAPIMRRVRAFFAPLDRTAALPALWDPAGLVTFNIDRPAAPWIDLGWCDGFVRKSGTKSTPVLTGAPAMTTQQVRSEVDATVSLAFTQWGKLQLALSCGSQQTNILASPAVPLLAGSSATSLSLGAAAAAFNVGDCVAVDVDYNGASGFVGSGVSGGYVRSPAAIGPDADYVRRITLNVARVTDNSGGVLTLGAALLAGAPATGMQVSRVAAFCDREGGSFFQEWSALFVIEGESGDRVVFHYPRLQSIGGAEETHEALGGAKVLRRIRLAATFRALPVVDSLDGERVVCFRSYLPGPMRAL